MSYRKRIGVLRGGPSVEHEVSLRSGSIVINSLHDKYGDQFAPVDIFINKNGIWHMNGVMISPHDAIHQMDYAWNALHGTFGEDGKIQNFLEIHDIPFNGSGSVGSAMGMNKILSKKIFQRFDIRTPRGIELSAEQFSESGKMDDLIRKFFNTLILPAIVKPARSGSSYGISIVRTYGQLPDALLLASKFSDSVMIEEYISGIEATCAVIEDYRGEELYALPPVEIRHGKEFFDYEAKYNNESSALIPSSFNRETKKTIELMAKNIHRALGLKHYSRSDFIIHPRRGVYAFEVNTLPGLSEESTLYKSLTSVGSNIQDFIGHTIALSLTE